MDGSHTVDVASASHSGLKARCICAIARVHGVNGRHIRSGIEALHRASRISPESHRKMENWQRKSEGSCAGEENTKKTMVGSTITFDPNITFGHKNGPIPSANPKLKHFRRSCLTRDQVAHYPVADSTLLDFHSVSGQKVCGIISLSIIPG
ncbi:hypothetical protein B0H10DRAFT_1971018 [Mycena sp. CBHHK59/15]|nr:hypothetical protein B0H10DRAFT_1971018 [Mycena sp. CBHHK59/15]